jgi:hypothetical protein
MTPTEIRAAARLAAQTLASTAGYVEQVHQAVAARTFLLTEPAGTPVRLVHDTVARGVHACVRITELAAGTAAGEALAAAAGRRSATPAGSTPGGNLALALLNAAIGHRLAEEGSPLARDPDTQRRAVWTSARTSSGVLAAVTTARGSMRRISPSSTLPGPNST